MASNENKDSSEAAGGEAGGAAPSAAQTASGSGSSQQPAQSSGLPVANLLGALLTPVKTLLEKGKALELELDLVIDPQRFAEGTAREDALAKLEAALRCLEQWVTKVGVCEVHTGPPKKSTPPRRR